MKATDNYSAKLDLWAREATVWPLPKAVGIPTFSARKFRSYRELNAWKRKLLAEIARNGGVQWTR